MSEFKKGDEVEWQSHGSTVEGEVVEKITKDTHKPDALRKQK